MAKDNTLIFSDYKIPRAVAALAIPSVLGMLINIIYNLADTFFVGQTGDANQVAAVSISMPLYLMFMAVGNLFGVGGCAYISRSLGEGRKDRIKTISSFCIYTAIVVGIILSALFMIFREKILRLVGASDNTIGYATDYLFWLMICSPLLITGITCSNLMRGEGAAKDSVIGVIIGQVGNIILDPIFIMNKGDNLFGFSMPFGFGKGAEGAAIATVIGNCMTILYYLIYFLRGKSILSITPKRYSAKDGIAKNVISVGTPAALNNLLMSLSNVIINMLLAGYNDNAVAAMGITMKANMLVVMFQIGIAQGVQPLIGYCYGARNYKRMKGSIKFAALCNIIIGTTVTIFYIIFREQVIGLFIDNKDVVAYGTKMLTALMTPGPVLGIMFIINFAFQGMGKGIQSFILAAGRQGLIYLPMLFFLDYFYHLDGLIWAQPIADFICVIISVIMFAFTMKKIKNKERAELPQ